jgi:hypothetical protein
MTTRGHLTAITPWELHGEIERLQINRTQMHPSGGRTR